MANEPGPILSTTQRRKKQIPPFNSGLSGLDPTWVQTSEEVGELQKGLCGRSTIPKIGEKGVYQGLKSQ